MTASDRVTRGASFSQSTLLTTVAAGFLIALCAVSIIISLLLISRSYQPVLFGDQWDIVELFVRFLDGKLSFADLIAQHNEHRIFIPRLVFLLDLILVDGRNTVNFAVIVAIQVAHVFVFHRIVGSFTQSASLRWALTSLVAVLFLSIRQWENFVWGFQHQFVGVFFLCTVSAYALASAQELRSVGRPYLLAMAAGILAGGGAALMMANGVLVLVLIAAVFALAGWNNRQTAIIGMTGLILLGAYVMTYTPNPGHTPPGYSAAHPFMFAQFVALYLGSTFSPLGPAVAKIIGAIGAVVAGSLALGLVSGHVAREKANVACIVTLLFIAASAALTGLGRLSFGIDHAASSRYATPSAVFWAAVTACVLNVAFTKLKDSPLGQGPALTFLGAMTALVISSTATAQLDYRKLVQPRNQALLRATHALLVGADDREAVRAVYPDVARLKTLAAILRERHLSIFSEVRSWELGRRVAADRIVASGGRCLGRIDRSDPVPLETGKALWLEGSSWNLPEGQPFDRLVFLSDDGIVVGYATTARSGSLRPASAQNAGRWLGYARAEEPGSVKVFGVLADENKLCPLGSAGTLGN